MAFAKLLWPLVLFVSEATLSSVRVNSSSLSDERVEAAAHKRFGKLSISKCDNCYVSVSSQIVDCLIFRR